MAVDERELYPLTTPAGDYIPFEVFRPSGLILVAVDDAVSANITIPVAAELIAVDCDIDCIVRFGDDAEIPADGDFLTDAFYLRADTILTIDPNEAEFLTVIAVVPAETGVLRINATKKWKDLQIDTRLDRT